MEGKGAARPPWLGFAVHVYNSIAAWADLLLARPRTFRWAASEPKLKPYYRCQA